VAGGGAAAASLVEAAREEAWRGRGAEEVNVAVEAETFSISMAAPLEEWTLVAMDEGSRGV